MKICINKHNIILFLFFSLNLLCAQSAFAQESCDDEPRMVAPFVAAICNDRTTNVDSIYLYNLSSNTKVTVASGADYASVDLTKDYVVYTQDQDLHIYQISSASETVLTGVVANQSLVRISGVQVYYVNAALQLESYNLSTLATSVLSAAGQTIQHFAAQTQKSAYSYSLGVDPTYNTINYNPRTFSGGSFALLPTSSTMIRETSLEIDLSIPFWIESYSGMASGTVFLSFGLGSAVSIAPLANEEITYGDLSCVNSIGSVLATVVYDSYDSSTGSWSIKSQRVRSTGVIGSPLLISNTDPTFVKMLPKIDGQYVIWLNETGVGNLKEIRLYDLVSHTESAILP